MLKERIIALTDEQVLLVRTNAPEEVIVAALEHKNKMLENDEPMDSDFEEMQYYIWGLGKGYVFEEIGYVEHLESYEW